MPQSSPSKKVIADLSALFRRNGYVRRPNPDRRAAEPREYKKGYEVRLVADSKAELKEIKRLLLAAGLEPGRPFAKANQWRQPLYGREAVSKFLDLIRWKPSKARKPTKKKLRTAAKRARKAK